MSKIYFSAILTLLFFNLSAQTYYPLIQQKHVMWGQGYKENSLKRMPEGYQTDLPSDVWTRVSCSSGLQVRFHTNASSIVVRYSQSGSAYTSNDWYSNVGANGFDLYMIKENKWNWCYPETRTFGSTFNYSITTDDANYVINGYDYCLYLPSFISISSLSIMINIGANFEFIPVSDEKPIVFYGTSIIHGAASTRPGNTITNIISREMITTPIINMGLSACGRMEPEVIKAINTIDAQIFIIDCLPNMMSNSITAKIMTLCINAVDSIKKKHPNAAIVLTEHPGSSDTEVNLTRKNNVLNVNRELKKAYAEVLNKNYSFIYYLSQEEIGLDMSSDMADYIHPNDKGMHVYAAKYLELIKKIQQDVISGTQIIVSPMNISVQVYPNPVNKDFFLKSSKEIDSLTFYSIEGKKLFMLNNPSKRVSTDKLAPGIYYIKVQIGGTNELIKICKQ